MARRPPKKHLVISSLQGTPDQLHEDDTSLPSEFDEHSSIKSMGSFKLRFRTGSTIINKPTETIPTLSEDLQKEPEEEKGDGPPSHNDVSVPEDESAADKSLSYEVAIPRAQKTQLHKYEAQKESFTFDAVDHHKEKEEEVVKIAEETLSTENNVDGDIREITLSNDAPPTEENAHVDDDIRETTLSNDAPPTEENAHVDGDIRETTLSNDAPPTEENAHVDGDIRETTLSNDAPPEEHTDSHVIDNFLIQPNDGQEEQTVRPGSPPVVNSEDTHTNGVAVTEEPMEIEVCLGKESGTNQLMTFENGQSTYNESRTSDIEEELSENVTPDPESFHFFQPEEEPVMTPAFQERALRSVTTAIFDAPSPTSYSTMKCAANCEGCCTFDLCVSKNSKTPALSPESHAASKQGLSMMKKLLYPGLPKIFVDIWVLAELAVTIAQFVLAITALSLEQVEVFNIVYLVVASIGLVLALIDSFIHFIQLGSCATFVKYFRKKRKHARRKSDTTDKDKSDEEAKSCIKLAPKTKRQIGEVLDFIRNITTDVVLYPLLVLDLFDLVTSQSVFVRSAGDRVNLSLFVIGAIFLVLSVYLVRIVMIVTAGLSLRRVPSDASHSHKAIVNMVLWFLVHVSAQILVHGSIFVSLGMNIYLENTEIALNVTSNDLAIIPLTISQSTTNPIYSSFFLIYSCATGLFVTLLGVFSFFIVNYYQLRELSVAFWVDMISLLQSENFAGLIFKGDGVKVAKKKAKGFAESIKLKNVKKDLKTIKSTPLFIKLLYPFRVPVFVILGILYVALLATFLCFLSVVCRPVVNDSTFMYCESFFLDPSIFSIPYFITFVLVLLANAHIILLVGLWLSIVLVMVFFVVMLPVALLIYFILYIPLGSIAFCITLFQDLGSEMDVLAKPSEKVDRLRRQHVQASVRKTLFGNEVSKE